MARSNDGAGDFDDLGGVSVVVDRDEAVDVGLDARSSELEEGGSEERDPVVADRDWRGRLEQRMQDQGSKSVRRVRQQLADQKAAQK